MSKKKKTNYQVTIGYRAVLQVPIKAENIEEAKALALKEFEPYRHFGNKIEISDDSFRVDGILDMDSTYNMLYSGN